MCVFLCVCAFVCVCVWGQLSVTEHLILLLLILHKLCMNSCLAPVIYLFIFEHLMDEKIIYRSRDTVLHCEHKKCLEKNVQKMYILGINVDQPLNGCFIYYTFLK